MERRMKELRNIIYLIMFIVLGTNGCSDKKEELKKLMEEKNYTEARILLQTFSDEELNTPRILMYKDTLKFIEADSAIALYRSNNEYQLIDSLLNAVSNAITISTQLKDSITTLKEYYAFKGAEYYNEKGKNFKAFEHIQKYLSKQYFTKEQSQILNHVLKDKINGGWA